MMNDTAREETRIKGRLDFGCAVDQIGASIDRADRSARGR
jgi:hypothetical protein